ncbi:3-oxoacyl-[acyl-carrier-protein] synthase 3 protein 1 [Actinomycetes bacterium]|nr:3-oxoacyl-[acyl-carrier-protein] synthase 3 protein 1 [Actinomycetes bacterium]
MTSAIKTSSGAKYAKIMSVGGYRPERIVTNAEICEHIDSSDEWIRERSGIIERRYAALDETVVDMGAAAAAQALERSGIAPEQIGMVLTANVTHPYQTPSAAAEIAYRIGAVTAGALDIAAACAGFCYGVGLGNDLVCGGTANYVIVIGVEKLSDWTDPKDRGSAFIFADGAGAVVIGPSDTPAIGPTIWGADGSQKDAITMTQSWIEYRKNGGEVFPNLVMQGQQVFRWAVSEMPKVASRALDAAGVQLADLDAFIPHQANMRITDAIAKSLKLPAHIPIARDIAYTGNTSAASVPLAMDSMLAAGEIPSGGTALLIGFGAGLVYAAQVVILP